MCRASSRMHTRVVKSLRRHRVSHQGQTVTLRRGYARLRWSWRKSVDRSHSTATQRRPSADALRASRRPLSCWFHQQHHDQKQSFVSCNLCYFYTEDCDHASHHTHTTQTTVRPIENLLFFIGLLKAN